MAACCGLAVFIASSQGGTAQQPSAVSPSGAVTPRAELYSTLDDASCGDSGTFTLGSVFTTWSARVFNRLLEVYVWRTDTLRWLAGILIA
jgi:hypothetical protein